MISFKQFINETSKGEIGIFSGRFQPVTKAHSVIINNIAKENKKAIIYLVKGKKSSEDKTKNPFDVVTQKKMLELVAPSNVTVEIISTGFFVGELNKIPGNINFNVYAGTDRVKSYEAYTKYVEEGKTINVKEIVRTDDDISATKVRQSLKDNDLDAFKKITDPKIHGMFNELRDILG